MKSLNQILTESSDRIKISDAISKLKEVGNKSVPVHNEYTDKQYKSDELAKSLEEVMSLCGDIYVDSLTADDAKKYLASLFK